MRDLGKILNNADTMPEYGYGVITPDSMIVFNGRIGARYTPRTQMLTDLAKKHGNYSIPNMKEFIQKQKVLDSINTVSINTESSSLLINFGKNSKIEFPIVLNIGETYPHIAIPWLEPKDKKDLVPLPASFYEMASLLTNEGAVLWQDDIGIMLDGEKMLSFDLGIFMSANVRDNKHSVFVPKSLLDLTLNGITHAKKVENGVIIIGEEVQYFATVIKDGTVPSELSELVTRFGEAETKKMSLTFSNTIWKRAGLLAKNQMNISVKKGTMYVSSDTWVEELGKLAVEDCEFSAPISLIKRWMRDCMQHSLAIDSDGHWLLHGQLRQGGDFYGTTTLHTTASFSADDAGFDMWGDDDEEIDSVSDSVGALPEDQKDLDDDADMGALI